MAASAVLVGLLAAPFPVHAQINGWMSQMNPWGPTYNPHTAPNIMTPRMNYTPPVTIPQTIRQFNPQMNFPQANFPQSYSPQGPFSGFQAYSSYPQNYGPMVGMDYQAQGPSYSQASPGRTRRPEPTAPPTQAGTGGLKVTITQSARGGTVTLPGSNIPIQGFGAQTPFGYQNNYPYAPLPTDNGPALLGGYYYGNYTDTYCAGAGYAPSVYSVYSGLPQYIYNVGTGLTVVGDPYYPVYVTPYQPYSDPQVTYNQYNSQTNYQTNNQYNYYGSDGNVAKQTEDSRRSAVPADSYQAAFGDIERAWKTGDLRLLQSHIRDNDTRLSVYFQGKYSYSVASGDFLQITRDAFDRLHTVSFQFTRLRKAQNGDVTAYGKQLYRTSGAAAASDDVTAKGDTVPFRTDGTTPPDDTQPYDRAGDPTGAQEKTVYVSYILRRYDNGWDIIGIDTSPTELAK